MSADAFPKAEAMLPVGFETLEPFSKWSLRTESERIRHRQSSTFQEIVAFRDALLPRLEQVFAHLGTGDPDALSGSDQRLFYMVLSLAEIAPAVEFYRQPKVVDGFDALRFMPVEDCVLRPRV